MTTRRLVLALDQGTTSSRAILFDQLGHLVAIGQHPLPQVFPRPGWVEVDPWDIWSSQWRAIETCMARAHVEFASLASIGIANQRESVVLWSRSTGKPIYNAISWQCRRTAGMTDQLKQAGWQSAIRSKTGLVLDPYFSATKAAWILDAVDGARTRAEQGEILFGTVDSWLIYQLTQGRSHITDVTNASRTMLFNIHTRTWDDELLQLFRIPAAVLPTVVESSGICAEISPSLADVPVPIAGVAGDQQAALIGNGCFSVGTVKNTYGTGCFLLMNTGDKPVESSHGLISTIAWSMSGHVSYALEGSIFAAGSVIQWLRDEMGIIATPMESEEMAWSIEDSGDVFVVPAFSGLGAPYWDSYARGTIVGLTQGTTRAHVVRAALESIAYQTCDVVQAMCQDSGLNLSRLRMDGGASVNGFLAQFQADMLGVPVDRPNIVETTALGAAFLAGLAIGLWTDLDDIQHTITYQEPALPQMERSRRESLYQRWTEAVGRSRNWAMKGGEDPTLTGGV